MSGILTVALDESLARFVADEVASGRFGSAAEVVRAALQLLENEERRLAALRDALREGEESDLLQDVDFDLVIAQARTQMRR